MSDPPTILILQADDAFASELAGQLREEGYSVQLANDGLEGIEAIRLQCPSLVILDWMLPGCNGLEVLAAIRGDASLDDTPVMMLTTRSEESDVVIGLFAGADEYVTKPCSMPILKARVAAMLRRHRRSLQRELPTKEAILIAGPFRVDLHRHHADVAGDAAGLTLTEFKLLVTLIEGRGQVFGRNQLIDKALGMDAIVTDRTIDVHITSLRKKLGDARWLIETVRGVGYRLSEGS